MKRPRLPLFALSFWALAASGLLIAVGNLLGLTETAVPLFPRVDSLGGLLATSLLLLAIGMLPMLFVAPRGPRKGSR